MEPKQGFKLDTKIGDKVEDIKEARWGTQMEAKCGIDVEENVALMWKKMWH